MADTTPFIRLRIGCAGWSIATAQQGLFDRGESLLERYATRFNAVEINSSFYRPHRPETYARWAASVPDDFRFAVKMPRAISHYARLRDTEPLLDDFFDQVAPMRHKLGCLHLQLPPSMAFEARAAGEFLDQLRQRWPGEVACEPRHVSWFDDTVVDTFTRHRVARVVADPSPCSATRTAGSAPTLQYWRLHGSPRMYYSAYDDEALSGVLARISEETTVDREAWVMFDNTAHQHAIPNALRLQQLAASPTKAK